MEIITPQESITFDWSALLIQTAKMANMLRNIFNSCNSAKEVSWKFTLYKIWKTISMYEWENNIFKTNAQWQQKIGSGNFWWEDDFLLFTWTNTIQHAKINNSYWEDTWYSLSAIPIEYKSLYEENIARSYAIVEILEKEFWWNKPSFFRDTDDIWRDYPNHNTSSLN